MLQLGTRSLCCRGALAIVRAGTAFEFVSRGLSHTSSGHQVWWIHQRKPSYLGTTNLGHCCRTFTTVPTGTPESTAENSPAKALLQRAQIEDGVMGLLTRYTVVPIKLLQLETPLESLESVQEHDPNIVDDSDFGISPAEKRAEHRRLWDVLDTVEFVLDVERFFGVTIPDAAADEVKCAKDAVDAVVTQLKANNRFIETNNDDEKSFPEP